MSLELSGVKPKPIDAWLDRTSEGQISVRITGNEIPMSDFRCLVMYALCDRNLTVGDQRLELLEDIRSLTVVEDEQGKHLAGLRPLAQHFSERR